MNEGKIKTEIRLEPLFQEVISGYTNDETKGTELWRHIQKQYSHFSRYYHTLSHLDHLAGMLVPVKKNISQWDILVLAMAYHDIIYNPRKSNNEERSAEYADKVLSGILSSEKRELLSAFIMATKAHVKNENEYINYFTDADLSILGASSDEYLTYTKQIRNEYKIYPLFIYKPGRAKVVRHFLDMDVIFKTDFFYKELEVRARKNLQGELDELPR